MGLFQEAPFLSLFSTSHRPHPVTATDFHPTQAPVCGWLLTFVLTLVLGGLFSIILLAQSTAHPFIVGNLPGA